MEKKYSFGVNVFAYENKEKHPIYVSKNKKKYKEKYVDALLVREEGQRHYALVQDFNIFMYDHRLHIRRKHFMVLLFPSF